MSVATKKKRRRPEDGRHMFDDLPPKEMAMVLTFFVAGEGLSKRAALDVLTELCWRVHRLGYERGYRVAKSKMGPVVKQQSVLVRR